MYVMVVWWIVLIVSALFIGAAFNPGDDGNTLSYIGTAAMGTFSFAMATIFWELSIGWGWIFLSPVWALIAFFVPGGFTITNLIFKANGLIVLPTWGLIVGIVLDVICLVGILIEVLGDRD